MKTICVIGLGYIGLPTAAVLANNGHKVIGVDVNKEVIKNCNAVKSVFPENSKKLAQGIIDHVKYIQDIGAKKISQEAKKKIKRFYL